MVLHGKHNCMAFVFHNNLFHLTLSPMFIRVIGYVKNSFLLKMKQNFAVYAKHILFIHFSFDGHMSDSQVLAFVNNATYT